MSVNEMTEMSKMMTTAPDPTMRSSLGVPSDESFGRTSATAMATKTRKISIIPFIYNLLSF